MTNAQEARSPYKFKVSFRSNVFEICVSIQRQEICDVIMARDSTSQIKPGLNFFKYSYYFLLSFKFVICILLLYLMVYELQLHKRNSLSNERTPSQL